MGSQSKCIYLLPIGNRSHQQKFVETASERMERIFTGKGKEKEMMMLISDNIDIDMKSTKTVEGGHQIMIKGSSQK